MGPAHVLLRIPDWLAAHLEALQSVHPTVEERMKRVIELSRLDRPSMEVELASDGRVGPAIGRQQHHLGPNVESLGRGLGTDHLFQRCPLGSLQLDRHGSRTRHCGPLALNRLRPLATLMTPCPLSVRELGW